MHLYVRSVPTHRTLHGIDIKSQYMPIRRIQKTWILSEKQDIYKENFASFYIEVF